MIVFFGFSFNPPGVMSAGLTCTMTVKFEPKVSEEGEGVERKRGEGK